MFRVTDIEYDIAPVRDALERVKPLFDRHGQIGVTSRPGAREPLNDAVGWLSEGEKESDFSVVNETFRDTAIEGLLESLPFRYGRTRLMKLGAKSCLSVHIDPTPRYHYAIVTNPDCYLLSIEESAGTFFHIPADGKLYRMEAYKTHTAINTSTKDRFHLVICAVDEEHLYEDVPIGRVTVAGASTA